jgi:hypothetical protein
MPDPRSRLGLSLDPDERRPLGPSRRRYLRSVVAGIVALACAGGLWFAYQHFRGGGTESGDIPIIRADKSATRIKPDNPGGEAAPEEDEGVYAMGKQNTTTTEHLLPPPEEPMAKPTAQLSPPVEVPPPQTAAVQAPQPAPVPPAPAAVAPAPKPVATTPKPTAAPAGTPSAAAPTPAGAASAASGPFRVQIAATKDDSSARTEWVRLQKEHPDLLGTLSLSVERADLGDRGIFFRLQAGPLGDHAAADKLCTQLRAVSVGCLVVHGH